ncbi:NotI family restriction endonuclease [Candidatus Glomeribacter gigasporarum]|uniref:NotI family restriction endonuclease n=1 Tax=Candidatus Glomeribacter gigasporarum TaxID=132144 RepID=UPI0009D92039|nr:NotI family restriction endonuclease [Candidatus Glomeribacter gigasporarum]
MIRTPETAADIEAEVAEEGKKAGRIDWILVNPATMDTSELEWCAVETQALYFSGDKMRLEFVAYAASPSAVLFPVGRRRPDYRSSGPKRLSPQLDVKVPVLRNWGKKVVVVIDRFFYDNMNALADAYPRARNDQERRDNSDVVWFVVDYDQALKMAASVVVFTSLESSRRALNATEPLSKADFTRNLKQVIHDNSRANKVFKASE